MQFQLTILLHLGLLSYTKDQEECNMGACRPPTGNLLVGRSAQLTASSTCGLRGVQKYCILSYLEEEQKCFVCDSRFPYDPDTQPNSHTIENVIASFEPDREKKWWQSENGLDHVSVRLNLEALFQFSHLILKFKTFRPAAMLVERSTDYGHTWKVFKYFAKDCAASFPSITSGQAQEVGDIVCDSKYSDIEPSTGGEVVLKALDPSFHIENPYSSYIQDLVTLTNLRINFTKLHTLGDTLLGRRQNDSFDKYYYAVSEMVVRGSCFCNGHASECGPRQVERGDVFSPPGMVHGQCVCQHNTDGPNCEKCKDFFQDAPWQPAAGLRDSTCRACRCNHHAQRCHFDRSRYVASGGLSGGVCEDCQHHTEGPHCERCKPLFYRDPSRPLSDPYTCLPCECDPDGTISGGICVSHSDSALGTVAGQCLCKEHVEGAKCDRCKPNYYGLSATDPQGCQACNCHPMGTLPLSTCDVDSGQCPCQPFATGLRCEECIVGYWGLESHLHGCVPCACDAGGAYSNTCSPKTGQCECRPNLTGQACTKPAPGYFFALLNFYLYEAEEATPLQGLASLDSIASKQVPAVHIIFREPVPGTPVTWTGPGLVKVLSGTGLRFAINNIPFPMDFAIAVRYEAQTAVDWTVQIMKNPSEGSKHCPHKTTPAKSSSFTLPTTSRIVLLPIPICLEPDIQYSIDVYFSQSLEGGAHAHSHILVDSIGLIPQISSLENSFSKQDLEDYQLHNCMEIASETGSQMLPGVCERLIVSLSALLHNGALACNCHPQGSVGPHCSRLGGQCQCQPLVTGRCCDRCSPGSYNLSHRGCLACLCHSQGSKSTVCDQITGQCSCHRMVSGRRCDQCLAGYFGFPNCRPCLCNGFAELCDPETGFCFNCKGFTTGRSCEKCIEGYYGNPSSGQSCRPCRCPGVPSSKQYFAHSCYQNPWSTDAICNCHQGYTGGQCEECAAGFYGNPRTEGSPCQPCACNNNIDITDAESCSRETGECLRCLHNTQGSNCHLCKLGYFGSAFNQTCRRCSCHSLGVNPAKCSPGLQACLCDPDTGSCPCLPNVTGQNCDRCADGYWNLVPNRGCQPCDCDSRTSHNNQCDQFTGQCPCKLGYGGKHCRECKENHYRGPLGQCMPCDCNREGTQKSICDQATGMCHCREGVIGQRCDHCARGYGQEFPACLRCHLCFDLWDHTISSLSKAVQGLIRLAANMEDKRETLPVCGADFKGLRKNLYEIEKILKHPVVSTGEFLKIKDYQDSVRKQIMQLSKQLETVYEFQDLKETIITMGNTANFLAEDIQKKIDLYSKAHNASIMDSLENIKMYYQRSSSAEKITKETSSDINNSKKNRNVSVTTLDKLFKKGNLSLEILKQIKIPDVQILSEKVCGDLLCVSSSCTGPSCPGPLNLSRNAFQKARETESVIQNLNNQVQGLKTQIKNTSLLAEVSQNNTLQLSEKLRKMKNQSESEEEKINLLITKLKKIVLEEYVPSEDIEKIANHVLAIHLPIASQNLSHKLGKIREFTQFLEDYKRDENSLKKATEEVPKILQKAKESEEAANDLLNLDNMLNGLQQVQIIQGRANSTITQLTAKIAKIRKNVLQAENEAKETQSELNLSEQQLKLKGGLSQLQSQLQRNREQTLLAKAQAESAQHQAGALVQDYAELKNQFAALQHKASATGLTKEVLGKVQQLRDAAEKLAGDTEDKIRRITDLEKKIQDLNLSRQEKVDQLKQLEDQVIAIKNEIVEQENKYAECYT